MVSTSAPGKREVLYRLVSRQPSAEEGLRLEYEQGPGIDLFPFLTRNYVANLASRPSPANDGCDLI